MGKATLFIIMAVALTATVMYQSVALSAREIEEATGSYENDVLIREIAHSALNMAVAEARRDFIGASGGLAITNKPYQGGDFDITATSLSPESLRIDVVGRLGEQEYRASRTLVSASLLDAAIMVEAPTTSPSFASDSIFITGLDTQPPSSTRNPMGINNHAIKANTATVRDQFRAAVGGSRAGKVQGINGVGDIVHGTFSADLQGIFNEALIHPQRQTLSGTLAGSYGTSTNPAILVVDGAGVIGGTFSGYGLLVVNGSLTVQSTGHLNWEGLVLFKDEDSIQINVEGSSRVYGSVIMLQGSSAFTMPVSGRLEITYLDSEAGFQSAVYVHPYNQPASQVYSAGSNRDSTQMSVWEHVYGEGQQINFFIRTYPSWAPPSGGPFVAGSYYDHYARGHESTISDMPYALVVPLDEQGYRWQISFEDLDEEYGYPADWDYNDQIIRVEVIPDQEADGDEDEGAWWTYGEEDDDSEGGDDSDQQAGEGGGAVGGEEVTGSNLSLVTTGPFYVFYSSEAIGRLNSKLSTVRAATQIVEVAHWEEAVN